jgi:DnaK suppressor protein
MEHNELEQFKRILKGLLKGLEGPLRRRDAIAIEETPDTLDRVQNANDRELAIRQLELDTTRLRSLQSALQRIEEGTYGLCLSCDEEIGIKRLRAVPWAAYCLACQDAADREKKEAAIEEELAPAMAVRRSVA